MKKVLILLLCAALLLSGCGAGKSSYAANEEAYQPKPLPPTIRAATMQPPAIPAAARSSPRDENSSSP